MFVRGSAQAITAILATLALALIWAPSAGAVVANVGHGQVAGIATINGVSPTAISGNLAGRLSGLTGLSSNGNLDYHGGPVLHASAPYLVFWDPGGQITAADKTLFERYFADVAHDSGDATNVYSVDRQFTDSSGFADYSQSWSSTQAITDTQPYPTSGQCGEMPSGVSTCLYDSQLQTEVQRLITADGLPSGFTGTAPIYFVVTPPDVNSCIDSTTECADNTFCAYHSSANLTNSFLYANIPTYLAVADPKGCQDDGNSAVQSPNGNQLVDVAIKYISHEDNETITDPLGTGWWDSADGEEDGDNCNFTGSFNPSAGTNPDAFLPTLGGSASAGTLYDQLINNDEYYVQSEWSNGNVNCEMRPAAATLTAAFSAPATAPPGTSVSFNASASSSSAGFSSVTWNFGDGSPPVFSAGSPATVNHTFASDGTYTVTLTEVDKYGNLKTVSHAISVHTGPIAAFTSSPANPLTGTSVSFDGTGSTDDTGTISSYKWDWGDGSSTTAAIPTANHTYTAAGSYTVTLTVSDGTKTDMVSHPVKIDNPPTAAFSVTTASLVAGAATNFDGSASGEVGGSIASYSWNWGDGTSAGAGETPSHTYAAAGDYTVSLTVTDQDGHTASVSHTVPVSATTSAPLPGQPKASITVGTAYPVAGWGVPLSAAGSTDLAWNITSWEWSFGDGATGSGQTLTHSFAHPGTYPVTLTVADGSNAHNTTTMMLSVGSAGITGYSVKTGKRVERLTLQISGPGNLIAASRHYSVDRPESFTLNLKLAKAQRKRLKHGHSVRFAAKLRFVPSVGQASSRTVRFTVRP